MVIRLLFICIFLSSLFLNAQDNFQISYSATGDEVIEWIIPANDGNLILAGNTNSLDPSGDGLIMKTDLSGNVLWSKTFGGPGGDEFVRIIACDDGGYVAVGSTYSYGQGGKEAWVTRISEDGDVVWSYCFGTYSTDAARGIIQTGNGSLIVVGHELNFDVAFILALTSRGELQWKKEYFQDIVIWFNDIYENKEHELYFPGAINHNGFGIHDTFILKTDSAGNFISCKYFGDSNNDSFRTLMPYLDGFLVVGDSWSWQGHQLGWMARLNSDLEVEMSVVLGNVSANQYLESACLISDNIFVDLKLPGSNSYIIELDSSLALIQSWQFNPGISAYSSHLISQPDSSIIFTGYTIDDQTMLKDIYLTRFHPGEFSTDCNFVHHSTYIEEVEVQSAEMETIEVTNNSAYNRVQIESVDISLQTHDLCMMNDFGPEPLIAPDLSCMKLYPNPASGLVNIAGALPHEQIYVKIYDNLGLKVMGFCLDSNTFDISCLKPGVYTVELVLKEKIVRQRLAIN